MKRVIISFLAVICLSITAFSQNHIAIQAVPYYAPEDDWSTNSVEFSASYVRDLGSIFHVGAGMGIGTAKPVKYYSMWKLGADVSKTQEGIYVPVFLRGKIDFGTRPSHGYFATRVGTKLCSVDGYDGTEFNPYIFDVVPAVGYDIRLGEHKLGIEFSLNVNKARYQEINFKYEDILNKYIYDNCQLLTDSVWASYGIAVTFEF